LRDDFQYNPQGGTPVVTKLTIWKYLQMVRAWYLAGIPDSVINDRLRRLKAQHNPARDYAFKKKY
jgi:hypothetical protein